MGGLIANSIKIIISNNNTYIYSTLSISVTVIHGIRQAGAGGQRADAVPKTPVPREGLELPVRGAVRGAGRDGHPAEETQGTTTPLHQWLSQ